MRASLRSSWASFALGVVAAVCAVGLGRAMLAPPPALAQIPDAGAQRLELIQQQRVTNERLAQVVALLKDIRDAQRPPSEKDAATVKKHRP